MRTPPTREFDHEADSRVRARMSLIAAMNQAAWDLQGLATRPGQTIKELMDLHPLHPAALRFKDAKERLAQSITPLL